MEKLRNYYWSANQNQLKCTTAGLSEEQYEQVMKLIRQEIELEPTFSEHLEEKISNHLLNFNEYLYRRIMKYHEYELVETSIIPRKEVPEVRVVLRSTRATTNLIEGHHALYRAEQNMCVVLSLNNAEIVTIYNDDVGHKHTDRNFVK